MKTKKAVCHSRVGGNPLGSLAIVFAGLLACPLALAQSQQPPPASVGFSINPDNPKIHGGFSFARTASGLPILNFTTVLRDSASRPMTGEQEVTFLMCPSKEGGSATWSEVQKLTADAHGMITAPIGTAHPEGFPVGLVNSGEAPWLGWQVGEGPEQQARLDLTLLTTNMYWNFLQYQSELDRKSAELEAKGEDGSRVRGEYQRALGFTDAEFSPIRDTADRLAAQLKELSAQSSAITCVPQSDPEHSASRPSPAERTERRKRIEQLSPEDKEKLRQLADQRKSAVQEAVAGLRAALGPDLVARTDEFVEFGGGGVLPHPLPAPAGGRGSKAEDEGRQ